MLFGCSRRLRLVVTVVVEIVLVASLLSPRPCAGERNAVSSFRKFQVNTQTENRFILSRVHLPLLRLLILLLVCLTWAPHLFYFKGKDASFF